MNEKGFTLIEFMIAVLVLGIGMLAVAKMQITAMSGNFAANNMTMASTLAQDKIEALKGLAFDNPDLADTNHANNASMTDPGSVSFYPADHLDPNNPIDSTGRTEAVRRFTRLWNIADNTPMEGVKTMVVFVCWGVPDAGTGLPRHRVSVVTTLSEH